MALPKWAFSFRVFGGFGKGKVMVRKPPTVRVIVQRNGGVRDRRCRGRQARTPPARSGCPGVRMAGAETGADVEIMHEGVRV